MLVSCNHKFLEVIIITLETLNFLNLYFIFLKSQNIEIEIFISPSLLKSDLNILTYM